MKICKVCNTEKSLNEFYKEASSKDGHSSKCKICKNKATMTWRELNPEKYNTAARGYNKKHYPKLRLNRYGISLEHYNNMIESQNNKCYICDSAPKGTRPLVIDHNHTTGAVRGLLCYGCNRALHVLETPELMIKAVAYLKKFNV